MNITECRRHDCKQRLFSPSHLFLAPLNVFAMDSRIIAVTLAGGGNLVTDWHCCIVAPDKAFFKRRICLRTMKGP